MNADSVSHEPLRRPRLSRVPRDQPNELRASSELPYLITNMGLQISFLAKRIAQVGQDIVFEAALNCYDESKTHPCGCTIYLVQDVRGVQAQRAEPYCVGSVPTDGKWKGWGTRQFLVKPIWIPPVHTNSMRYQSERIEMQNLKSEGFLRVKEMAEIERRNKDKEIWSKASMTGLWIVIGGLGCIVRETLKQDQR
jgi:hypothetical protein